MNRDCQCRFQRGLEVRAHLVLDRSLEWACGESFLGAIKAGGLGPRPAPLLPAPACCIAPLIQ